MKLSEKAQLQLHNFVVVLFVTYIIVLVFSCLAQVLLPVIFTDEFEPDTAVIETQNISAEAANWQQFPLKSPDGAFIAYSKFQSRDADQLVIVSSQSSDIITSLTIPHDAVSPYQGAWLNNDVVAIRLETESILWRWREVRVITPRRVFAGIAIGIALMGLIYALIEARRT